MDWKEMYRLLLLHCPLHTMRYHRRLQEHEQSFPMQCAPYRLAKERERTFLSALRQERKPAVGQDVHGHEQWWAHLHLLD